MIGMTARTKIAAAAKIRAFRSFVISPIAVLQSNRSPAGKSKGNGSADYVVNGDNHLLKIAFYRKMRIIMAEAFLEIVPAQTPESDPD